MSFFKLSIAVLFFQVCARLLRKMYVFCQKWQMELLHTDMLPHCIFRAVAGSFLSHLEVPPTTSISVIPMRGNILHLSGHSQLGTWVVKGDQEVRTHQGQPFVCTPLGFSGSKWLRIQPWRVIRAPESAPPLLFPAETQDPHRAEHR